MKNDKLVVEVTFCKIIMLDFLGRIVGLEYPDRQTDSITNEDSFMIIEDKQSLREDSSVLIEEDSDTNLFA